MAERVSQGGILKGNHISIIINPKGCVGAIHYAFRLAFVGVARCATRGGVNTTVYVKRLQAIFKNNTRKAKSIDNHSSNDSR